MKQIYISDEKFDQLRGNVNIKSVNSSVHTTKEEYEKMATEIIRCKNDIVYFAENYFTIIGDTGEQIIKLYPKQKELIEAIVKNQNTIVLAARQAGKSTVYTIYALWYVMFHKSRAVLLCANKQATAMELMERIQLAYELLPSWLKLGCSTYRAGKIVFENKSKIEISSTSASAARGKSGEVLIIDEAAHIPNNIMDEFVQSVLPIVSSRTNSKIIVVSTPNGLGNWYAETYHKALYKLEGAFGWNTFRIDWWDVPGRDDKWAAMALAEFNGDKRKFAQEYGNAFIGSAQTLISGQAIKHYKTESEKYLEHEEFPIKDWMVNVWHKPIKSKTYAIGCDIAEGVGGDYSTALVLDITNTSHIKICASFGNNTISPTDFAYILAKLSKQYNGAVIAGERNGIGKSTMDTLWNIYQIDNVLCWKSRIEPQHLPGIFSHNKIKVDACIWFKTVMESFDLFEIEFNEKAVLFEIDYFEKKMNSTRTVYQAVQGKHDDYILALIWGMYLLEPTVCDFAYHVENSILTKTGIPVPRIIRHVNTGVQWEDEFEEHHEFDNTLDIDIIHKNMTGKIEEKPDEDFSLDDDPEFAGTDYDPFNDEELEDRWIDI